MCSCSFLFVSTTPPTTYHILTLVIPFRRPCGTHIMFVFPQTSKLELAEKHTTHGTHQMSLKSAYGAYFSYICTISFHGLESTSTHDSTPLAKPRCWTSLAPTHTLEKRISLQKKNTIMADFPKMNKASIKQNGGRSLSRIFNFDFSAHYAAFANRKQRFFSNSLCTMDCNKISTFVSLQADAQFWRSLPHFFAAPQPPQSSRTNENYTLYKFPLPSGDNNCKHTIENTTLLTLISTVFI